MLKYTDMAVIAVLFSMIMSALFSINVVTEYINTGTFPEVATALCLAWFGAGVLLLLLMGLITQPRR